MLAAFAFAVVHPAQFGTQCVPIWELLESRALNPLPAQHGDSAMRMRFWSENTRGLACLTFRSAVEISNASAYRTPSTTRLPLQSPVTLHYHHAGRVAHLSLRRVNTEDRLAIHKIPLITRLIVAFAGRIQPVARYSGALS